MASIGTSPVATCFHTSLLQKQLELQATITFTTAPAAQEQGDEVTDVPTKKHPKGEPAKATKCQAQRENPRFADTFHAGRPPAQ